MCMSTKAPKMQAPPTPSPMPTVITPSEVSAQNDVERRKRLERQRYGAASLIKTSQRGLTGAGAELVASNATGNKTLG